MYNSDLSFVVGICEATMTELRKMWADTIIQAMEIVSSGEELASNILIYHDVSGDQVSEMWDEILSRDKENQSN